MGGLLVTGGAGFIGSNFIRYHLAKYPDEKIINLDKLTYAGNLNNLRGLENNPHYYFIEGDICDRKTITKLLEEADIVVNFAAESHVDRSILSAREFVKTNVEGTVNLLEAANEKGIEKFVQVSTDEVYGSIESGSFTENDRLNPRNPYAASKAASDLMCRSFFETHDFPVVITRSTNNFGPYQYPEKFIPVVITNLIESKKIPIYGEGKNVRDWLYVEDNCRAIDLACQKGKPGEIYNVAGGNEVDNLSLAKKILEAFGKTDDNIEFVKDRPGHDMRYSIDCSKIKELGWQSSGNFKELLNSTVKWYEENKHWWVKIKSGDKFKEWQSIHYKT